MWNRTIPSAMCCKELLHLSEASETGFALPCPASVITDALLAALRQRFVPQSSPSLAHLQGTENKEKTIRYCLYFELRASVKQPN